MDEQRKEFQEGKEKAQRTASKAADEAQDAIRNVRNRAQEAAVAGRAKAEELLEDALAERGEN